MNSLAKKAAAIFDSSENIYMIVSPTKKILKSALILLATAVALITLSSGFLVIITLPLLLFEIYFYYLFCKIWRSYKFSIIYLIMMPIAAIFISLGIRFIIYHFG